VRRFLGVLVVLELLVGAGAIAAPTVDKWLQNRIDPVLDGTVDVGPPATRDVTVLRPDQIQVTGLLTRLVALEVDAPPLPTPFTVEAGVRGESRADIVGATVDGRRNTTIHWDGGRPLPITGEGALQLSPAHFSADASGFRWSLEGEPRAFTPGNYRCNFTVAVATEGIGSVREGVAFTADTNTALQVDGTAFSRQPASDITIEAAKEAGVVLEGTLTVRSPRGETEVEAVHFGPGLYRITLAPVDGGYRVDALLQGKYEV
jgi:hypothetical protein